MGSVYDKLLKENLLNTPPSFLKNNIQYEVITGSMAYGCNDPGKSDMDIYGFAIPPKDLIFPHHKGLIPNFDTPETFNQFQQHHVMHRNSGVEYDITIYNIVQFFRLCMENNPNMVDALFVPRNCVIFSTAIGEHVRDHAKLFLTKHAYHKFTGYAKSQSHKMKAKKINDFIAICKKYDLSLNITVDDVEQMINSLMPNDHFVREDSKNLINLIKEIDKDGERTKRIESIAKYGFDVKFAYHLFRLLSECEQILVDHDIVLNRDREIYKSVRRGDYTKEQVIEHFEINEKRLREIYDKSTLRYNPDVSAIRQLLLDCLEMHYGSLEKSVANLGKYEIAIREIQQILVNHKL